METRNAQQPGYWRLVAAGEPYRLLFPLGTLLGVVGVLLWPAFVWGGRAYPVLSHPGIMIEGFLGCFVIGFLGTALPRLLDVPRLRLAETAAYATGLAAVAAAHLAGLHAWADGGFFLILLAFVTGLKRRARERKDIPPPGFVLVALGMLCGLGGSLILCLAQLSPEAVPGGIGFFGKRLLHQGFLLLPVMGVGAFLLPRFFGLPNRQSFPESLTPPPGWMRRAGFAAACGLTVLLSLGLEAAGYWRAAFALRAVAVLVYFFREVPVHQAAFGRGPFAGRGISPRG